MPCYVEAFHHQSYMSQKNRVEEIGAQKAVKTLQMETDSTISPITFAVPTTSQVISSYNFNRNICKHDCLRMAMISSSYSLMEPYYKRGSV
uniref:Uncharacterized protein n=1 Tax=Echinococcus canadensis TaxID=519352 RepID=A0A915EWU6_9CEST